MNIYAFYKRWVFCQLNKVKTSNACSLSHCLNSYDESFSREYLVSGSEDQIKDTFLGFLQLWKSLSCHIQHNYQYSYDNDLI